MSSTPTPLAALESVLCTEELNRRPARPPDYERESRALVSLAQALADSPRTILQTLADLILEEIQADSVGISLVAEDGTRFHWPAIAGVWKPHIGEGTPRDFGPCGDVLDRNCPLLFSRPERRYTYFQAVTPPIEECLLVPFYVGGQAVGTIWAIAHDDRRKFDSEDLRMLVSLGTFASAAHQAVEQSHALKEQARERQDVAQGLREMNEALLVSSIRQHELTEQAEKANAALCESEDRFRVMANAMPQLAWIARSDGHIFWYNQRWYDYTGTTLKQMEGWGWQSVHNVVELPKVLDRWKASIATGEPFDMTFPLRGADGIFRSFLTRVIPLKNAAGQVLQWFGTNTDVEEIRRTGVALRESEERYRDLFDSIDEGFCVIEMIFDEHEQPIDYRFLEANPTFERQTGLHDAIGKRMRELRPNLEEHWFEIYGRVALTGETIRFVNEAKTMEGRWFDVYALRVGAPESRKVAIVFNDITERRQSEEALRHIERSLRFIMDSMPQKIFTAQPNGDIDYFNPQWTEFTGMSVEQMQDSGWTRFVHPDDVDEKTRLWRQAFDTGEPFQSEHRFRRANGEYRWHISRGLPMRDETGRITMWVGSNTDVHDMKQAEAALQEQATKLVDLDRRKDEFLAMLSHELRSPLAPIANAVQLLSLQQGSESRIQQQARSIIERQLGQLQHLVDDLLEVSRITTGRVQLRRERVVISDIVNGAVETARPLLEQRRHELTVSLPPEPIWLIADAARLEQVLVNLLNNAAKYTETGGHVWVTVELEVDGETRGQGDKGTGGQGETGRPTDTQAARQQGNETVTNLSVPLSPPPLVPLSHVLIRVRDNGIGIDPALLPRIFDLFTQAERSLDRSQGGLGIGLALVQRMTELHGGTVEASSTLGQGSEFVVRLPLLGDEGRGARGEHASLLAPPLKVLIVDDNVDTVSSFSMLLRASGHDVRTAHDGFAAIEAALDYQPDVMLLDIGLPGLNGYEVAKRIRQEPTLQHVVLVALTGYGQESDRQTSRQAGFNHHMVKPADFNKVQQILATVLEQMA